MHVHFISNTSRELGRSIVKAVPELTLTEYKSWSRSSEEKEEGGRGRDNAEAENKRISTFHVLVEPSVSERHRSPDRTRRRETCANCAHLLWHTSYFMSDTWGTRLYSICQFRGCCTLYWLWEIRTVTSWQTYCANLGFKMLQASPSKTSLSKCNCIFPALCLLAADRLLKILSWIWLMFWYFKENVFFLFFSYKVQIFTVRQVLLSSWLSKIHVGILPQKKSYL